jgi:hypothetical protein
MTFLHVHIDTVHDPEALIAIEHIVKVETTHLENLVKVTFTNGEPIYVKAPFAWFKEQLENLRGARPHAMS